MELYREKNKIHNIDFFEAAYSLQKNSVQCIICDGPYGLSKGDWDSVGSIQKFNLKLIKIFSRLLVPGGSLYLFGKHDCIDFIDYREYLNLRRRIIWYQPSRLAQGRTNYTNNYDIIAYFTKGQVKTFDLDAIRVPQLVELAHRKRCENVPSVTKGKFGKTKFNEQGKNPGDVWGDIKQLTYRSKELLDRAYLNTIQKPEKLIERMILASSKPGDLVLEPFAGTGTASKVSQKLGRDFIAFEKDEKIFRTAARRLNIVFEEPQQKNHLYYAQQGSVSSINPGELSSSEAGSEKYSQPGEF